MIAPDVAVTPTMTNTQVRSVQQVTSTTLYPANHVGIVSSALQCAGPGPSDRSAWRLFPSSARPAAPGPDSTATATWPPAMGRTQAALTVLNAGATKPATERGNSLRKAAGPVPP